MKKEICLEKIKKMQLEILKMQNEMVKIRKDLNEMLLLHVIEHANAKSSPVE
jgi:hypothetical protein